MNADMSEWFAQVGIKRPEPEPEAQKAESDAYLLSLEVGALWGSHRCYQTQSKEMRAEAARVRERLAELLYQMRNLLAIPGCCGRFSQYLREHRIPRSSANRLIALHERRLNPESRTAETISIPSDGQIRKLAQAVLPRVQRVIPSVEYFDRFVVQLRTAFVEAAAERAEAQAAATMNATDSASVELVAAVPIENPVPWQVAGEVM
jgi:hypothetical protein